MPSFSQSFLASLGQPRFAQGMFDVGQAIGGIGGQLAEKKRRETEAQELAGLSPNSAEYLQTLARQYEARGDREAAIKYGALAKQAKRQEEIIRASQGMFSGDLGAQRKAAQTFAGLGMPREAAAVEQRVTKEEVNRGKTALARYMQSISAKGEDLTSSKVKEGFDRIAGVYGVPFEDSQDIYKSFEKEPEISSAQAVSLVGKFTPASIDKFTATGNFSDLKEIEESFTPNNLRTIETSEGIFALYTDESGKIVTQKLGDAKKEPEAATDAFQTRWASDLLQNERELARKASLNLEKIDGLVESVKNRSIWQGGLLGKAISETELALGLGGDASTRIARLNEIRMSKALSFLPKGPASDRDVQLALDATVDIVGLKPAKQESYLRGLRALAQAEKDYHAAKADFMVRANDPNALGFDQWADKKAAERDFSDLKSKAPGTVQGVFEKIKQANSLETPAEREAALAKMAQEFPEVYEAISNLESARSNWQTVKSQYTNLQGIY